MFLRNIRNFLLNHIRHKVPHHGAHLFPGFIHLETDLHGHVFGQGIRGKSQGSQGVQVFTPAFQGLVDHFHILEFRFVEDEPQNQFQIRWSHKLSNA